MKYNSTMALVVKVIDTEIFEGTGEVGKDGHAVGFDISVCCIAADEIGKLFNVDIHTSADTREGAIKIVEELSCNSIHYIRGVFFLDSDEKYDIMTVFNPSYEPVSIDKTSFYLEQFNRCNCKKGEYLYRAQN